MMIFLTITAIIWFLIMTVFGNISVYQLTKAGKNIHVRPWTLVVDILVTAFLISRVIGAL